MSQSATSLSARKPVLFIAAAVLIALWIATSWKPVSYAEQLVHVQAEQELGPIDRRILKEPLVIQATLLDYSGDKDKELVLKAWIAISKYQTDAREILAAYGSEPEFRAILKDYGEAVIPVIQYFRDNDVWSVVAMHATKGAVESASDFAADVWNRITGKPPQNSVAPAQPSKLGPKERGWYAVVFIKNEGHNFLGQFVVTKDRRAKWIQTDRIVKSLTSFFTSGIRTLEAKRDLGEDITIGDAFWAGLDVVLIATPIKLLRAGKVVTRSGKEFSLAGKTRLFAPRLVSKATMFRGLAKYGAVAATVYIVATHPSLINSLLAEIGDLIGVPRWLAQFGGWFLLIAVALYPFGWLLKGVAQLILFCFSWLEQSRWKSVKRNTPTDPNPVA